MNCDLLLIKKLRSDDHRSSNISFFEFVSIASYHHVIRFDDPSCPLVSGSPAVCIQNRVSAPHLRTTNYMPSNDHHELRELPTQTPFIPEELSSYIITACLHHYRLHFIVICFCIPIPCSSCFRHQKKRPRWTISHRRKTLIYLIV